MSMQYTNGRTSGCLAFEQQSAAKKGVVMKVLNDNVEQGESADFVQVKGLLDMYVSNRILQRDNKPKKDA